MDAILLSFNDLETTSASAGWICDLVSEISLGAWVPIRLLSSTGRRGEPSLGSSSCRRSLTFSGLTLGRCPRPSETVYVGYRTARGLSIPFLEPNLPGVGASTVWKCDEARYRPIAKLWQRLDRLPSPSSWTRTIYLPAESRRTELPALLPADRLTAF